MSSAENFTQCAKYYVLILSKASKHNLVLKKKYLCISADMSYVLEIIKLLSA